MEATTLTVGRPQQMIERYATMREHIGNYQRQLFLVDHAGLPLELVPTLRNELAGGRGGCPRGANARVDEGSAEAETGPSEPALACRRGRGGTGSLTGGVGATNLNGWLPPVWYEITTL